MSSPTRVTASSSHRGTETRRHPELQERDTRDRRRDDKIRYLEEVVAQLQQPRSPSRSGSGSQSRSRSWERRSPGRSHHETTTVHEERRQGRNEWFTERRSRPLFRSEEAEWVEVSEDPRPRGGSPGPIKREVREYTLRHPPQSRDSSVGSRPLYREFHHQEPRWPEKRQGSWERAPSHSGRSHSRSPPRRRRTRSPTPVIVRSPSPRRSHRPFETRDRRREPRHDSSPRRRQGPSRHRFSRDTFASREARSHSPPKERSSSGESRFGLGGWFPNGARGASWPRRYEKPVAKKVRFARDVV